MSNPNFIPPNVAQVLPPFVKNILGYQPLPPKHRPKCNTESKIHTPPRKFNLWKPDRMPIFMPLCGFLFGLIVIAFLMHQFYKDRDKQLSENGICSNGQALLSKTNIAFVFAHPDDEVMFFSPTILAFLSSKKYKVNFLCFSTGNAEGLGKVREKELMRSGLTLGVGAENIHIIDHNELQDGMKKEWDESLISELLVEFSKKNNIEAVITFDESGVSGHINHISVYNGVSLLMRRGDRPKGMVAYKLQTTNSFRKFYSFLDIPYTYLSCEVMFINSWADRSKALQAMTKHESQWVWFRKLYMWFSRYMIVNNLIQIEAGPEDPNELWNRITGGLGTSKDKKQKETSL